jgi:hypothetical protein
VAPSVRFKVRAMLAARVFLRAIVFNVLTSDDVHDRRFDFLGINNLQVETTRRCSQRLFERKGKKILHCLWKKFYNLSGADPTNRVHRVEKCDWTIVTLGG